MANKIKYGLSNVYIAFQANDGYGTPAAIKGAVNLSLDPEGSENPFYADNTVYFNQKKNNGYTGTLEMALVDDTIKAEMFGDYIDANGKYVEDADGRAKPFALMFQVEGDESARRTVFYDVTASRPGDSAATDEDTITPQTETVDVTIVPHEFTIGTGQTAVTKKIVKSVAHEGDTEYATFFSAVVLPGAEA